MTIQYDGTRYRGWQKLGDDDKTIQGKLENVLSIMTGEAIEIIGSGRTDAGVHAINQVANFHTNSQLSVDYILDYCYKYLPEDIVVKSIEEVDERFHTRYNAKSKKYLYRIWNDTYHDVFTNRYFYHEANILDIDAMNRAVAYLVGEHDFSSFTTLKSKKKSMVREIYSIDINKEQKMIDIMFCGNGFLYNMVRIIAGTLIDVGLGKINVYDVKTILDSRDRSQAGPTAPAKGLFLLEVEY